jgi:hypothetical protein
MGMALVAVAVLFMARAVPSDAHGWIENPPSRNFLLATYNYDKSAGNGLGYKIPGTNPAQFQNPVGQPGKSAQHSQYHTPCMCYVCCSY